MLCSCWTGCVRMLRRRVIACLLLGACLARAHSACYVYVTSTTSPRGRAMVFSAGGSMDERWHVESKMRTSGTTAGTWDSVGGTAHVTTTQVVFSRSSPCLFGGMHALTLLPAAPQYYFSPEGKRYCMRFKINMQVPPAACTGTLWSTDLNCASSLQPELLWHWHA